MCTDGVAEAETAEGVAAEAREVEVVAEAVIVEAVIVIERAVIARAVVAASQGTGSVVAAEVRIAREADLLIGREAGKYCVEWV